MTPNSFLESLVYVASDQYFLLSMATTTMIGIFLGATLYDGLFRKLWRALLSLGCYGLLMIATTSSRVIPLVQQETFDRHHPYSGIATVLLVSVFYFFGLILGVFTTAYVNRKRGVK